MRIPVGYAINSWKLLLNKRFDLFTSGSSEHPLSLTGIHFSTKNRSEMVEIFNFHKQTMHKENLHHLLHRKHLLKKFHSLDLMLLSLLAKEDQRRHHFQLSSRTQKIFSEEAALSSLSCVNAQFYSDRTHREMVILTLSNSDRQLCLSVRELVNDRELINKIRNSEFKKEIPSERLDNITLVAC